MPTTLPYELQISDDQLEAVLLLRPEESSDSEEPVTMEALIEALQAEEKLVEIDEDAVAELLALSQAGEEAGPRVVARGIAPVDGEDGRIEWLGEFFEQLPLERPDGSIDYYHRNKTSVAANTIVARLHPPTSGQPGRSVTGQELPAQPGEPRHVKLQSTVEWVDESETRIRSLAGGRVESANDQIGISDLLELKAVGLASSSIEFDGAVHVKGDVQEGFRVEAGGSVQIDGFVETAPVKSGGSLSVRQGIIGRNKIEISAAGDMEIGFARELELRCGGQLISHGELLFCTATVVSDVTASNQRILGGNWSIGGSLYCAELGSESETPTVITVGANSALDEKLKSIEEIRQELHGEIERREEQLQTIQRRPSPSEKEALAQSKLEMYLENLRSESESLLKKERSLRVGIRRARRKGTIWISETIYPGVTLWAGGCPKPLEIHREIRGPVRVGYLFGRQKPAITAGEGKDPHEIEA